MNTTTRHGLGFGGAVGLSVAATLLIAVIAIGHALLRQLTGAIGVVITFAEIAVCTLLAAAALAVIGLLAYRGQLARLHLAERRAQVDQLATGGRWAVHAEVLEGGGEALRPTLAAPAIQGKQSRTVPAAHLWSVPDPADRGDT